MFGTLRFVLALFVALEHFYFIKGFHIGAFAVAGFYMLAGYVMAASVRRDGQAFSLIHFYADRCLRIFPLYWIVSGLIVVCIFLFDWARLTLTPASTISAILLVPLQYYMVSPQIFSVNGDSFPIPPAPSLALEIHYYALCPFLILFRRWAFYVFLGSLTIFSLSAVGIVSTHLWGYALWPGTLFLFITGQYLFERHSSLDHQWPGILKWSSLWMLILIVIVASMGRILEPHILEVASGFLVCQFLIDRLGAINNQRWWDIKLGELSYSLFLSHFLVIYGTNKYLIDSPKDLTRPGVIFMKLGLVLLASLVITMLFDRPLQAWRRSLRR